MVSALVTCTIHIFAVCVAVRTVIERGVHHHQNHDAVDSELFIEHWWSIWRRALCAVVNSPSLQGVEDSLGSLGSLQSSSKEGARQAQVHL